MYLIREIMYCKPGKVRPMVEKFVKMSKLSEKVGMPRMRGMPTFSLSFDILTNFSTIGRTLPGLQYMISRMRYMDSSREIVPGQLSRMRRAALFGGVLI